MSIRVAIPAAAAVTAAAFAAAATAAGAHMEKCPEKLLSYCTLDCWRLRAAAHPLSILSDNISQRSSVLAEAATRGGGGREKKNTARV